MELQIESMDSNLRECLTHARKIGVVANVVNIFNKVINIELTNPSLLITLSKGEVTPAPYTMKAVSPIEFDKFRDHLNIGDTFRFKTAGEMIVNDDKVIYSAAKEFSSLIDRVKPNEAELSAKLENLDYFLQSKGNYGGLLNAYLSQNVTDHHLTVSLSIYDNYFRELLKKLSNEFTAENLKKFIGLGVGLTPSGDDFIVGLISVLSRYDTYEKWLYEIKCEFKKSTIDSKTTRVSTHMINYALEGYFNGALIELMYGGQTEAMVNVNSIGSTSGTDMLTGVGFGLNQLIKFQKERAS